MIALEAYRGRKVGVFGLGKAGEAAIAALHASGAEVYAWDDRLVSSSPLEGEGRVGGANPCADENGRSNKENPSPCPLPQGEVEMRKLPFDKWPWQELAALVLSPGVPLTHPSPHPVVVRAKQAGCPVLGEVELLYEACPEALYIGITGTNGKSTTTSLIGHILAETGYEVEIGGNLGTPALALEPLDDTGIYVLEMSSYQLDLVDKARFDIAVLLNFTPDHLDRHGDMAGYIAAKRRIFANHDREPGDEWERGVAIIAVDDADTQAMAEEVARNPHIDLLRVSARHALLEGVSVEDGVLHDRIAPALIPPEGRPAIALNAMPALPGRHNWQNAAAAYAAARICGVSPEEARQAMQSFPGLRHRMQLAGTIGGVRFINDSKATNADATANALAPYDRIYWILGGKPKAGGIDSLEEFFPRIAHAFLIGEAQEDFARTLDGKVSYTRSGTLESAVTQAARQAFADSQAAVVLLSPACASFDQFKSFEQRGDVFCALVEKLTQEGERHAV